MRYLSVFLVLLLSSCAAIDKKPADAPLFLQAAAFSDLPGWSDDDVQNSLPALHKSCVRILKRAPDAAFSRHDYTGNSAIWQKICAALPATDIGAEQARQFFENHFMPYRLWSGHQDEGLFTGYYEPQLHAATDQNGTPIYARPNDLVTVDLGLFRPELKGEAIAGRVDQGALIPYFDRAEITNGAVNDKAEVIARVDDPIAAFFLHVQGSGQVIDQEGRVTHVGYAAQNGHPYFAIGKALVDQGILKKEDVSMQSITAWLKNNPDKMHDVLNQNKSYIFFREISGDGPLGGEGVALAPERSLAVDFRHLPYGAPVFLDAEYPSEDKTASRLQRLLIAQDTGGAIRGAIRGDVFWGSGEEAAAKAGIMKSKGAAWILLPKEAVVPRARLKRSAFGF